MRRFSSIEPDGILNAWKTKVRAKVAKTTAISRASRYSRTTGLGVVSFDIRAPTLPDELEGAVPAGLLGSDLEEADRGLGEVGELGAETLPPAVRGLAAARPVDEERPAEQIARRQLPPEAGVPGVVAIVAHAEVAGRRHGEGAEVVPRRQLPDVVGRNVFGGPEGTVNGVGGVVHRLAVDGQPLVDDADDVAGHADAAFHHVDAEVLLGAEDDDVAPPHRAQGQQLALEIRGRRAIDEPVDEEVVPDQQGVLHRATGNVEGLNHERVRELTEDGGDDQRLQVFPRDMPVLSHAA